MKPPKLTMDFSEQTVTIHLDYQMSQNLKLLEKKLNISKRELVRRGLDLLMFHEGLEQKRKVVRWDQESKLNRKRKPVVLK